MSELSGEDRARLHRCVRCDHLLVDHDGAGCIKCLNERIGDEQCEEWTTSIETTYEAVARLIAEAEQRGAERVAARVEAVVESGWMFDVGFLPALRAALKVAP